MRALTLSLWLVFYALVLCHGYIGVSRGGSNGRMTMTTSLGSYQLHDGSITPISQRTIALRRMLSSEELTVMPCCYDGFSARMVEAAGFNLTFMTGFGVSASYGFPDAGLTSVSEM